MLTGKELGAAIKSAIQKKMDAGTISSYSDIAAHFKVKTPSIYDWVNKGTIAKDKLPELWKYFSDVVGMDHWGVDLEIPLLTNEQINSAKIRSPSQQEKRNILYKVLTGEQRDEQHFGVKESGGVYSAESIQVSHLAISGSMGPGADLIEAEEVIERITLKREWLRKNIPGCNEDTLSIISGKGNSMSPTFNDGDLLLVDRSVHRVDVDGVYVLSAHDRLFIKSVRQRLDGSYEIYSDNPSVKTVDVLNGGHEVMIHGRVVWAWNGKKL